MNYCGYCGKEYEEDRTQKACKACPLGSDCGLILCPHCGYENPAEPKWMAFIKGLLKKDGSEPAYEAEPQAYKGRRSLPVLNSPPEAR